MKLTVRYSILLVIGITILSLGCKKGEDDPFLSLRSRKTRVAGEWTLKKGFLTIHKESVKGVEDEKYDFDGGQQTYAGRWTDSITPVGTHSLKLVFDKKGKYRIEEDKNGVRVELSGDWDFENGTGKGKNKELLNMAITAVSRGQVKYVNGFNKSQAVFTYRIKELRNKKMVLVGDKDLIVDQKDQTLKIWVESQYEFEQ